MYGDQFYTELKNNISCLSLPLLSHPLNVLKYFTDGGEAILGANPIE